MTPAEKAAKQRAYAATDHGREVRARYARTYFAKPENRAKNNLDAKRSHRKRKLLLLDGCDKCERCGFADIRALDFHHPDPSKKTMTLGSRGKVTDAALAEARACEVLCSNCHRIHHCTWEDD